MEMGGESHALPSLTMERNPRGSQCIEGSVDPRKFIQLQKRYVETRRFIIVFATARVGPYPVSV